MSAPVPAREAVTGSVPTLEAPTSRGSRRDRLARRVDRAAARVAPAALAVAIGTLIAGAVIFRG